MTRTAIFIEKMACALADAAESWLAAPHARTGAPAHPRAVAVMMQLLAAAVVLLGLGVPVLLLAFPLPTATAIALLAAAIPLAAAGLLSATGSVRGAGLAALASAACGIASLAIATGGAASPFLALAAILPFEAAFAARSRAAVAAGVAAALVAILFAVLAGGVGLAGAAVPGAAAGAASLLLLHAGIRAAFFAVPGKRVESRPAMVPVAAAPASDLLDRLPGLVTVHDARGEVTRVGGAERTAFNAAMGDLSGKGFLSRIHVSDRIAFLDALDTLRQGAPHAALELRLERRGTDEGQFVHVAVDLMAERDATGGFSGAVAQTRDITAIVEDRVRQAAIAEQADSANAAKTRFLAAVSHELRTPLNAIIGFSDILAREYFGTFNDERQREYVGLIYKSGHHLLSVVNTMLDMSKIEAGRYELLAEPFAIGDVVDGCGEMLALQASEKGVTMTRRVARGVDEVVADRRAVQQILINLMGNAIKFTEAGGVVTTDVDRVGGDLRLVVSDTGIGMSEAQLARIGEPFVQGQNSLSRGYEGTGLGLSLVKGLVELHGGVFAVESREGEGTSVTVRLPLDGSGIAASAASNDRGETVEFPPRLSAARTTKSMNGDRSHDAQARIA